MNLFSALHISRKLMADLSRRLLFNRIRRLAGRGIPGAASGLLLLVFLAVPQTLVAESADPESGTPSQSIEATWGKWSKICTPDGSCQIVQSATQSDSGQIVLQSVVKYVPESPQPVLFLTGPLGIYLPKGISLFVDDSDKGKRISLQRCDQTGCLGVLVLQDDFLRTMKEGNTVKAIIALNEEQNLQLPISLDGFTKALASLQ